MPLSLEQKKSVVANVAKAATEAHSAVAAEYRGLTVSEMTRLRNSARSGGVYLRVVKNTLARRALEGTDFECMSDELVGPLLLAFSMEDPGGAARVVKDFSKEHEELVTKLVAIGGQVYPAGELDRLAKLPSRDEAISMLMGVMKQPVEKFVRTMAEPHAKLARTLAAVRDAKQAA